MNKRELALLERAYSDEIESALRNRQHLMQTKQRLAEKLVDDGLLRKKTVKLGGRFPMIISGYEITDAGRYLYCSKCVDDESQEKTA